eukprot:TRINITY_DN67551_c0_g1_i1.p2 TRINITY_DN67551_c0_g1~~TRINITY_DN67551_c0_g1_i1.p2  ORF type:complete len:136 (-),score=29.93 TRINITY_DN67551_c0_g1_i1:191-541(-)
MTSLADSNETKDICSAQWLLLWTTAAYAPETPDKDTQSALSTFFGKFQDQCRDGPYKGCMERALRERGPPPVNSRRELMLWLCMNENRCLREAGLPVKRCKYTDLMARWRYPDGYL